MTNEEFVAKICTLIDDLGVTAKVEYTTALLQEQILDSLEWLGFLARIESEFGVRLSDQDVASRQLGRVQNLCEFLREKRAI